MGEQFGSLIAEAAATLKSEGASEVYVFGSVAGPAFHAGSDVDLAVSGLPPRAYFRALSRATEILRRPVDLVDLDDGSPFARFLRDTGELVRVA